VTTGQTPTLLEAARAALLELAHQEACLAAEEDGYPPRLRQLRTLTLNLRAALAAYEAATRAGAAAWTRTPPQGDGYWWFRWDGDFAPAVVKVFAGQARIHSDWLPLAVLEGEWCGPLVPPGESESL
jgi:hypothetical protein